MKERPWRRCGSTPSRFRTCGWRQEAAWQLEPLRKHPLTRVSHGRACAHHGSCRRASRCGHPHAPAEDPTAEPRLPRDVHPRKTAWSKRPFPARERLQRSAMRGRDAKTTYGRYSKQKCGVRGGVWRVFVAKDYGTWLASTQPSSPATNRKPSAVTGLACQSRSSRSTCSREFFSAGPATSGYVAG